jgi:molybdate transport system substrate-binding protein
MQTYMTSPKRLILILLTVCCASLLPCSAQAQRQIHVLAAADLQPILPQLASEFEKAKGIKIIASYGSSANLATQIINGDPADLFLAADYSYPEKVVAANLADSPAPTPDARGTQVLWARKDSPFQPLTQITLSSPKIQSLAVADPLHAPYGLAAERALISMNLYDTLKPHLVVAQNIEQAAQFVESGNAQLGLISLTAASTEHFKQIGSFIRMQPGTYPEIRQCAVVLKKSQHRDEAHAFLDWLHSPPVQQQLTAFGLEPAQ